MLEEERHNQEVAQDKGIQVVVEILEGKRLVDKEPALFLAAVAEGLAA